MDCHTHNQKNETPVETGWENQVELNVTNKPKTVIPGRNERPIFKVIDEWTTGEDGKKLKPGVWLFSVKFGRGDAPDTPIQQWICSPLHIKAVTLDTQGNNYGRILRFKTTIGVWREWAMAMELLSGSGEELRGELLGMGVEIDPGAGRSFLGQYLQGEPPKHRVHCTAQLGWCRDVFVLPNVVIGENAAEVIFQSAENVEDEFTQAGTLVDWKKGIARMAIGNPLLILTISASFAGPLLAKCNCEGGGIHFAGDSSTGKSTLIEAACSVWGGSSYKRSWKSTANGMEGAASKSNDGLLALDEIGECEPREIGAILYALGNGRGKQRARKSGTARGVTKWRCIILSSGERNITTAIEESGAKAKAGHSVRMLDVPVDRHYGAWDQLHGLPCGRSFSDAIKRVAATDFGHAGRAFLEKLTRDKRNFMESLEKLKSSPGFTVEGGEGQANRGAGRFALLALAGELASEYGITGWHQGDALEAAEICFKLWKSGHGPGNAEHNKILDQVAGFIARHGDSRFSNADDKTTDSIRFNRAGWWRDKDSERLYLFTAEGMREAVKGFDWMRAIDILLEVGALPKPGSDGKRSRLIRVGGQQMRLYQVQASKLGEHDGA